MKYYGKIVKRGGKIFFYPMEAIEEKGVAPGEETIFPAVEQLAPSRVVITPKPVSPGQRQIVKAKKVTQYALQASSAAEKGLIITRPGASVSQPFYHKKSYVKEIQGKPRVTFFDVQPDPDGLITNIPEPYFRSPATFIGIKIDIEPTPLKDTANAYKYLDALQALTNAVYQLRINDQIAAVFSFKDVGPIIETDIAEVGGNEVLTIHFKPRPMVEFGDIIKSNFFSITSKDRVYLVLLSDASFPGLGTGAVDFYIKPYLFARVPRRLIGG
jgi:hypothetical protein